MLLLSDILKCGLLKMCIFNHGLNALFLSLKRDLRVRVIDLLLVLIHALVPQRKCAARKLKKIWLLMGTIAISKLFVLSDIIERKLMNISTEQRITLLLLLLIKLLSCDFFTVLLIRRLHLTGMSKNVFIILDTLSLYALIVYPHCCCYLLRKRFCCKRFNTLLGFIFWCLTLKLRLLI